MSIIVAMDVRGLIGAQGGLPWRIPEDLRYFRRMTWGKAVIMGRRTYESIGAPLEGRLTIVMSRNRSLRVAEGVQVAHSVQEGMSLVEGRDTFVAGGAQIYAEFLPLAGRVYATVVKGEYRGDTFFPALDPGAWRLVSEAPERSAGGTFFVHLVYERQESDG